MIKESTSAGEYIAGRASKNLNYTLDWQEKKDERWMSIWNWLWNCWRTWSSSRCFWGKV